MLIFIIRLLYFIVCLGAISTYINLFPFDLSENFAWSWWIILLALTQLVTLMDMVIQRKRIEIISSIYFGLLVGVLLSYLLLQALEPVFMAFEENGADARLNLRSIVGLLAPLTLIYISISFLLQTKDDFRFVIPFVEFSRELKGGRPLVLDSSALIDGRIADVAETQIIESQIIVPSFILKEVQDIADSNDKNRRTRGRRGLDVLTKLQNNAHTEVTVYRAPTIERKDLTNDQRLIEVASELGGRIVTNDLNLNKVASLQSVESINLNDVANALKPRFLPGDTLKTRIIKEGESSGQGVGYLDDGTMVVCEQAVNLVGSEIEITVTSVLQSSAGRMIFGRQAGTSSEGTNRG
ncbi:MAG: PIN/TRAM domain-containing protein [Planctomycetaceae bacterium]|nr:PIN/TRAM domain-containing protein [Planctomycetaceae bacterium]